MNNYDFKLTPAYCLYNGAAVVNQHGAEILFMIEDDEDVLLQERLVRGFKNYLKIICRKAECPEIYRRIPNVQFVKGTRAELRKHVSQLYENLDGFSVGPEFEDLVIDKDAQEAAAVLLLDNILHEGRNRNATDIHIERNTIKYRVHGKLDNQVVLQHDKANELILRIKLLAGMNVIEKRKSQDGHFIYGETNPIFVRVSSMAIISDDQKEAEESVVLRILDTTRIPLSLSHLGFSLEQYEEIKSLCSEPHGLIVICGPTGAGKSTTAASMLLEIQRQFEESLKIISLEDPPEYIIPGITQIQIDDTRSNTYEDALQHVFRQDPDVIMIGEIRDEKSAAAAIRASLTGHLVVATLHTSDAAGAVLRLENLGISRKIVASVLRGVIVQNLSYGGVHAGDGEAAGDGEGFGKRGDVSGYGGTDVVSFAENVTEKPQLIADVAIPEYSFPAEINNHMSDLEIEKLFEHKTNYGEVLKRTFKGRRKQRFVMGRNRSFGSGNGAGIKSAFGGGA